VRAALTSKSSWPQAMRPSYLVASPSASSPPALSGQVASIILTWHRGRPRDAPAAAMTGESVPTPRMIEITRCYHKVR
jgi:hypothetical protein